MIPFIGRIPAKQVMKSKPPSDVSVKNWVICGKSGRVLDFELYQGAGLAFLPTKRAWAWVLQLFLG